MNTNKETLTYRPAMTRQATYETIKAVALPVIVLGLALFTISNFASYGTKVICPMIGAMWTLGVITAFLLPVERKQTLEQTMGMCVIYCVTLLGLKIGLSIVSGASAEMIAASYDQPITLATGNALPGVLQNIMSISSIFIPGGYLIMLVKKLIQYRRTQSLQSAFERTRGFSETGKSHMRRY